MSAVTAAAVLALSGICAAPAAHAAAPVERSAAETYADLMAIQAATRTGWTTGYVLRAHGSSEGGWSWTESFDASTRTLQWRPGTGQVRRYSPTTTYVAVADTARSRAVLRLAGRPHAAWIAYAYQRNPDYYLSIGHEFDTFRASDADLPLTDDVVDSATVTTDDDGTRHWVVRSHRWGASGSRPNPDMILTSDPQGRLVASGGAGDGMTISYVPPHVARPSGSHVIAWSTYAAAEAAVTLRHRVSGAARSIAAEARRLAVARHGVVTATLVRHVAARTVRSLPASPAPVRWKRAPSGATVYGYNRFTRTWATYRLRAHGTHVTVTKVG